MKSKKQILLLSLLMLIASVGFSLTITSTLPNGSSDKDIPVEAGKEYEFNFDLDKQNTSSIRLVISEGTTVLVDAPNLSMGSNTFSFTTSSTTVNIKFQRMDADNQTKTFAVNNLSYTPHVSTQNHVIGQKKYEITDHLGNVRVVLFDKLNSGQAEVESATDYLPFGMAASGRTFSTGYRYGFNGQERVDELGAGHTTAEHWEYDSRIGRRWNVDPVIKPNESPYVCFLNNPLFFIDVDGDDATVTVDKEKKQVTVETTIYVGKDELEKFKPQMGDFPLTQIKNELKLNDSFKLDRSTQQQTGNDAGQASIPQNDFSIDVDGEKYTVIFNVNFKVVETQAEARTQAALDGGGNVLQYGNGQSFYGHGATASYGTIQYSPGSNNNSMGLTFSHELSHALGLNDKYYSTNAEGKSNIGSYSNKRKVLDSDVSLIAEDAIRSANEIKGVGKIFKFSTKVFSETDQKNDKKLKKQLSRKI